MRKQIAAANWKMNLSFQNAEKLLDNVLEPAIALSADQVVVFAVPFPYLIMAKSEISEEDHYEIAAQNCYDKKSGAYTGEVSVDMLKSIGIKYCLVGHSERREYFNESNKVLADKINLLLEAEITAIFCCGEALEVREAGNENTYVETQLNESLFHLAADAVTNIVIAYEPIWAIGTGKTASTAQAQDMHAHIRQVLSSKYGAAVADQISILYGGSVKPANAIEIFSAPDVDGGLIGGASLVAADFIEIIKALKPA